MLVVAFWSLVELVVVEMTKGIEVDLVVGKVLLPWGFWSFAEEPLEIIF